MLAEFFNEEEVKAIKTIPLSSTNQKDRMIWRGMTNGISSIKSAYHLAKEMQERTKAGCSREVANSEVWKLLWNLKVPNTEKHFIWRACNDILPTRENLHRRKIIMDPLCPICGLEVETTLHILWECPSTTDVWGASSKRIKKSCFTGQSFFRMLEEIGRKFTEEDIKLFVGLSRQVWLRRNTFIHPNTLVLKACSALDDFVEATARNEMERAAPVTMENGGWQAPPTGVYKANWDAALNLLGERIGIGVVVRDQEGRDKAAQSSFRTRIFYPTTAETIVAIHTLRFCKEIGLTKI